MPQIIKNQPSGLYIQTPNEEPIAFPLKHTNVSAKIAGNLSRVEVTQSFENTFTTTLEAVYIFPLPDEAAVDEMLIQIGDHTIKGNIKKREEAQQIYELAKQQGRTAGLLEQERDNIFTQSLANIKPGEQIDVIICYSDSLKFTGGNYEFVFPMVVGPRYIPGVAIEDPSAPLTQNQDTDLVPNASRLNAPILPEGMRSRHDINVTVEIDAGVPILGINSPSHQLEIDHSGQNARITLAQGDTIPNKDLMLRYQVAGEHTQTTVLTQSDERGGHFAVYLIPAIEYAADQIVPKDVVFLIDTSGSQQGMPLMQCQELMRQFINHLNPDDTFSIIDFANTTQQLSAVPLANTPQNRAQALQYINQLQADGGTELLRGIQAVLNFPVADVGRLRTVVLLTDGYIGNENQVLAEVQQHLKPGNRLHSFGAGSSVNRFLINRIAELGRGISRIIRHDEPVEPVVQEFFSQINNPVLTNIQVSWQGEGEQPVIYPTLVSDLFAEQPLVLFGKKPDSNSGILQIQGSAAGGTAYQQQLNLNFESGGNPAVAQLWGRSRIKALMNQMVQGETKARVEAVTETALTYQLLSQYTAFVAVSDDVRVNPSEALVSVQVPVEMPEAVNYEAIYGYGSALQAPSAPARASRSMMPRMMKAQSPKMNNSLAFSEPTEMNAFFAEAEGVFSEFEPPSPILTALEIVSATGLDEEAIAFLTQHLQSIKIPTGIKGDLVFELKIHKGRVKQVILDEEASTIQDAKIIELIRRSLLTWKPAQPNPITVILTLRIDG
ncbi:VIT domain-containing protein [Planktothrix pseudagardhii]|uniref:von Willebrand factor A domain-containing protein DDB_G0285981 n=1 Tax=Planktothrix pseudagardhii TaxID=132604 RepID=A0A9W4G5R2_9CYAN|nr:VIT domain-containing protein [Planktothrix pseudagardhii]CAD5938705.1 von Willebrand factor A domain-containing protein DDB_G0285981 [Planktothrix pseudagardhii]